MDQPLLTSSPQRASEAPILQSTIAQHTDAAFHCASYPSAPHFSIRPLQHPLQKTAITHTQNIFHILCFLYATNNSLEAAALVKSKGSGLPGFLYLCFCLALILCSVGRVFERWRTGQGTDFMKDGRIGGGVSWVQTEGRTDIGILHSFLKKWLYK